MKSKLTMMVAAAMACAAIQLTGMPTEEETRKAEPVVKKMLAQERAALESDKKTRSEVAAAAMKLAGEADTDAAKLLLMKGAFVLYVRDGKLEKAVETMKALKATIPDIPPQSVTNIIETALCGLSKENCGELHKLLDEAMKKHGDDLLAGLIALPVGSSTASNSKLYCVIDLSAGPNASNYPVSYLAAEPKGGWTDEYKTTKLVLRRIEPGKFKMRGQYEVTLTKPFYCGVFEVTQKQYELVTGNNPSKFKGDMRPVEMVSWNIIRGDSSKYNWPSSANVDSATFMGKIQARTGFSFDLPTEAQWEYACRAGTTSKFNNGGNSETDLKKLGRFTLNQKERGWCGRRETDTDLARHEPDGKGGCWKNHTVVGSYQPNAWGLYDMHGNVWEWCLDWWRGDLSSGVTDTDPQGSSSGAQRVFRGGSWLGSAYYCASSYWYARIAPSHEDDIRGFRLCMNPEGHAAPNVEYKFAYRLDDKGNAVLTGVSPKPEGALVCPNIIEGHKVTGIDRGAFGGCDKMTKIMLPEDLDTLPLWISGWCIHGSIFYGCTALSSIGISEKNLKFASVDGALYSKDKKVLFAYPKDRTEIKVCRETTSLQGEAFHSSLLFKKINVPEGILNASGFAFSGCPNLEEVVFPKGLEYIRHRAFWSCPNMKKVVFLGEAPVAPHRNTAWRENVFCGAARDIVVYVRKGSKGWNGKESTDLPERWPLDGSDSRPIRYIDEADAKSWAGVKDGQGIPLVFDGEQAAEAAQQQAAAEREQQLKVLRQLQEELRRQRKEKDAAQRRAGQAVNAAVQQQQATVDGYTWSYRVKYGAATIVSEKKGKYSCAVSPMPTGDVKIPVTLNGVKVTSIGDHAFLMCDGMTSVTIPSGVTNIGWSAFSGCRRLTSVTIPEGVKCIGKGAFSGCCGLTLVTIPASVMYIEDEAFSSSPELYNRETNGWSVRRGKGPTGNSLVSFAVDSDNPSYSSRNGLLCSKDGADLIVGVNGDINIPDGVKNISKYAFSDCRNLSSVTIPSSVTNIGFRAFYNCSALKFVTIPDNVTSIGASAFSGCSGLTSVKIPDSVTSIGSDAFAGTPFYGNQPDGMVVLGGGVLYAYKGECPSSVTIPSSVTSIGNRAFAACRGRLESVTIPSSVTNIDENAFWYCSGVKSFSVASDNPSYSSRNRMLCTKGGATLIAGVIGVNGNATIPEGVANIGSSAFNGYSGLKSVTIPNGVTNIESWAFHGCRGLTSVAIPEGVTSIGADAFLDCRGLTSVTIPDSVTSIGVCAFNGTPFYGKMPDGMVVLGGGVLCGYKGKCPSTVVIPSNVTSIAKEAFSERFLRRSGAGLKMVVISSSVTNIGSRVFSCCGDLTNLTMRGECPKAPNDIFQNCGKLKAIHVPANAKSWVGMKAWQGIPLVFDGEDAGRQAQAEHGAERQAAESAQRRADAEREQQREALRQIQEELRRQREAKQAEKEAGVSGIQTKKFPLAQGLELEMIKCPAGEFMMGYESWKTWASSQNRQLRKLHRVKLTKDFMLGKFPVTCSQWYAIMGNGKKAPKGLEDTPAGNITVPEMQAFCDKLTAKFKAQLGGKVFRLPTDAEWEYASKGGKNLDGMLGKTLGLNGNTGSSSRDGKEVEAIFRQMGYTAEDHARASDTNKPFFMWNPLAVGKYKPNEWGFMDLTGNAWEVTADTIMDTVLSKEGGISSFIHVWNGRQIYSDFEIDPLLRGERHLVRTGFWEKGIAHGIGNKMGIGDNDRFPAVGFRVCIGEPLGDWNNAFSLNAAPGSVTELDLGNVPPLQFVYCPAGKFSMGYKEQPALSKVKEIEITSPFWVSKTVIRAEQLEALGLNSITNAETGAAVIADASIVVQKLPSVLKERFGKMLPPGYVFRLPTEAEFEYLQKSETKDKDAPTNIWGVERLYSGGIIALLDRAPAYGKGVDVVNDASNGKVWTVLAKVNYENQPDKDPVGWSDDPNWSVFRRGLKRNCGGGKLLTGQGGRFLYGFYFVVAPDVDKLNKFYWK